MVATREIPALKAATYADLSAPTPEDIMTPIERAPAEHLNEMQQHFVENGFVVLEKFLPEPLIDAYCAVRERLPDATSSEFAYQRAQRSRAEFHGGWSFPTPFMLVPELRDLALWPGLMRAMYDVIGFPMALNLALTGWTSTRRKWHSDRYLNPGHLGHFYIAAWMALDDVHPDAGPFRFVRGSHRWPGLMQDKLFARIPADWRTSPHWPTWSQDEVARVCEEEMNRRDAKISEFVPKKGDVLLWHASLIHCGSEPKNPGLLRKSLICHYSSITHRLDMTKLIRHDNGELYFDLPVDGDVRPMQ